MRFATLVSFLAITLLGCHSDRPVARRGVNTIHPLIVHVLTNPRDAKPLGLATISPEGAFAYRPDPQANPTGQPRQGMLPSELFTRLDARYRISELSKPREVNFYMDEINTTQPPELARAVLFAMGGQKAIDNNPFPLRN